jgi:Uma2 family endonuclease
MVATSKIPPGEHVPTADQRVVMHGVPWSHFEAMLALRGEKSVPRMTYLGGVLELMSPSKDHERIKSFLGHLVVTFAVETGIELSPYGSWTLKSAPREAGVEPDECYLIGADQSRDTPDLAIEVIWTSGGIDKLEAYRRLGVGEVWFWHDGALDVYLLVEGRYERRDRSACLPQLDLRLVVSLLDRPSVTQAVRDFREALRDRR